MSRFEVCPFCVEPVPADATECPQCGQLLGPAPSESVLDTLPTIEQTPIDEPVNDFVIAYVRGAELSGAYLSGADLFGADLVAANLHSADLGGAILSEADLSRADLSGANLVAADLSEAQLVGADLRGANLTAADLSGAVYDDFTLWPDDLDPESKGAVHVGNKA